MRAAYRKEATIMIKGKRFFQLGLRAKRTTADVFSDGTPWNPETDCLKELDDFRVCYRNSHIYNHRHERIVA